MIYNFRIIDAPPTAELLPRDDGKVLQLDEVYIQLL